MTRSTPCRLDVHDLCAQRTYECTCHHRALSCDAGRSSPTSPLLELSAAGVGGDGLAAMRGDGSPAADPAHVCNKEPGRPFHPKEQPGSGGAIAALPGLSSERSTAMATTVTHIHHDGGPLSLRWVDGVRGEESTYGRLDITVGRDNTVHIYVEPGAFEALAGEAHGLGRAAWMAHKAHVEPERDLAPELAASIEAAKR